MIRSLAFVLVASCLGMDLFGWLGWKDPDLVIPKAQVDPTKMTDSQYCAEILECMVQQAIDLADKTILGTYEKMAATEKKVPQFKWRGQPAKVWCNADMQYDGYIDCYLSILGYENEQHSAIIARYFVISDERRQFDHDPLKSHYCELSTGLATYPLTKIEDVKGQCLKALFDTRSVSLQILSPYHPKWSHSNLMVTRCDGTSENFTYILVPTIPVPRVSGPIDNLETLFDNFPAVFNRIFMDPLSKLPECCLKAEIFPVVDPMQSQVSRSNVESHFKDTIVALQEFFGYNSNPRQWTYTFSFANRKALNWTLVKEIISILSKASVNSETTELLDCSSPLPLMTRSKRCPSTSAVVGLTMFQRVIHRKGLWIAIRGQHSAEAKSPNLTRYIFQAATTNEFYFFDIKDKPNLSYHKLHINNGQKGIFVIIIWEDEEAFLPLTTVQLPKLKYKPEELLDSPHPQPRPDDFSFIHPRIYPVLDGNDMNRQQMPSLQHDILSEASPVRRPIQRPEPAHYRPSAPPITPPQSQANSMSRQPVPSEPDLDDGFVDLINSLVVHNHPVAKPKGSRPAVTHATQEKIKEQVSEMNLLQ